MVRRQVEKVVATQLMEATREVLEHLSRWKIELNERGQESPRGLVHTYGRVRRVKDYLQRCVSAYPNPVELDLSEDDDNLLVSCAVHELGAIDLRLQSNTDTQQERAWLEEKRRNLSSWAIQLATRPVERIPSPDSIRLNTPTARGVVAMVLRNTAVQDSANAAAGVPFFGTTDPAAAQGQPAGAEPGVQPFGAPSPPVDPFRAGPSTPEPAWGTPAPPPPAPAPAPRPEPAWGTPPPSPPPGFGAPTAAAEPPRAPARAEQWSPGVDRAPAPMPAPPRPLAPAPGPGDPFAPMPPAAPPPAAAPQQREPAPPPDAPLAPRPEPPLALREDGGARPLLDPRRLRDPRLRAMASMDLRAFERSKAAQDYRLAMVHLSSVLEGAVMDYAIPRYKQLGIKGPPETWKVEDILVRVIGDRFSSMDRAYLFQVIAGRNLVRPAIQLHSPMVVTAASLEQAAQFVLRVLMELGFTGTADMSPPTHPAVAALNFQPPPIQPPDMGSHFRNVPQSQPDPWAGGAATGWSGQLGGR